MKCEILNSTKIPIPKKFISSWVLKCQKELLKKKIKIKNKNILVVFVSPSEIKKINFKFRKKNKPTDILSFEPTEEGFLGELVICPQIIKKQAKEHNLSFNAELGYMILHGILHLLGYDHEKSKAEAKKMFTLQDSIFERLI